jgi:hypothetical protein
MAKVFAKKMGQTYKVYMDPIMNRPAPLQSLEDEPAGTLAKLFMSIAELRANFPGAELQILDPNPTAPLPLHPVAKVPPSKELDASSDKARAIIELRILLAQYHANPKSETAKIEVEAVGNFILALWPALTLEIEKVAESFKERKFKI